MNEDQSLGLCVVIAAGLWWMYDVSVAVLGLLVLVSVYGLLVRWFNLRRLRRIARDIARREVEDIGDVTRLGGPQA